MIAKAETREGGRKQGTLISLHGFFAIEIQDCSPKSIARTLLARCSRRPTSCANLVNASANSAAFSRIGQQRVFPVRQQLAKHGNTGRSLDTSDLMSRCLRLLFAWQLSGWIVSASGLAPRIHKKTR